MTDIDLGDVEIWIDHTEQKLEQLLASNKETIDRNQALLDAIVRMVMVIGDPYKNHPLYAKAKRDYFRLEYEKMFWEDFNSGDGIQIMKSRNSQFSELPINKQLQLINEYFEEMLTDFIEEVDKPWDS